MLSLASVKTAHTQQSMIDSRSESFLKSTSQSLEKENFDYSTLATNQRYFFLFIDA